jgi:Ca2+-binding RTX toxin-like protein
MATNIGTNENDKIVGKSFKDQLFGKGGNDSLKGQDGNDELNGGTGNDTLTGDKPDGSFKDTFVFGKNSGKDVITDFDVKKDVIEIAKGINGIKKAADVLDHAKQKGKDVVIDLGGGNKITLNGVDLKDLKKHPGDHFDIS